jgi:hypothetical protein
VVGANDFMCSQTHATDMWYQLTPPGWWCECGPKRSGV